MTNGRLDHRLEKFGVRRHGRFGDGRLQPDFRPEPRPIDAELASDSLAPQRRPEGGERPSVDDRPTRLPTDGQRDCPQAQFVPHAVAFDRAAFEDSLGEIPLDPGARPPSLHMPEAASKRATLDDANGPTCLSPS